MGAADREQSRANEKEREKRNKNMKIQIEFSNYSLLLTLLLMLTPNRSFPMNENTLYEHNIHFKKFHRMPFFESSSLHFQTIWCFNYVPFYFHLFFDFFKTFYALKQSYNFVHKLQWLHFVYMNVACNYRVMTKFL